MNISIIGTGYVGLVTGACLADKGHKVTCVDLDEEKVLQIQQGFSPIYESGLQEILFRNAGKNLKATTNLSNAVINSEITFIAVGTPFDGKLIDLSFIKTAAKQIGEAMKEKKDRHTVVVKSTVVPGTTLNEVLPILEDYSGKRCGIDFGLGMNPEFLREGEAISDFNNPDRIVIGSFDEASTTVMSQVYSVFPDVEKQYVDLTTAEMIKYAANSLLATLISFSNEIANLSAKAGVDIVDVMRGVHSDRRLMPMLIDGTRIKPGFLSYLIAGCGFGGSCFPKDVKALVAYGESMDQSMELLKAVMSVNTSQPEMLIEILVLKFLNLTGLKVGLLGMAFKPGTDDLRESPSLKVAEILLKKGAKVMAYDPIASSEVKKIFGSSIQLYENTVELLNSVDAVMLMTSWEEFKNLPRLLLQVEKKPYFIDGRRFIDKALISNYAGIGLPIPPHSD
jgi:UDPglucose 6-dehydrogenase